MTATVVDSNSGLAFERKGSEKRQSAAGRCARRCCWI